MGTPHDPETIASLEAAVGASPSDIPLRLHLALILMEAGQAERCLEHCNVVLAARPDHADALELASRAARATGDIARADGYRRLWQGLKGGTEDTGRAAVSGGVDRPAPTHDEFDVFLQEVVADEGEVERPTIRLSDVGGLDEVKRRLELSFLGPLRNPELRKMYGKSLRGGLLLYGPPGCGKTFLARAVAGELSARFFAVGLHDVLDMWLGKSEQNLHAVFETARRNSPCVLFLDEVDALGQKRSHLTHSAGRNVVVQLLQELDSMQDENEGLFVLGATNQPWDVDPALRRPGRFDRMLLVLPPDRPAREAILRYHLRHRPVAEVDIGVIADATAGYSGADLRMICENAAEQALQDSLSSGTARPISMEDLSSARSGVASSTRPWFELAKNFAMFANSDGTYDELLAYMREQRIR
jgi:SpoVK/Ycf46/Vps4 family AAA+-type ATPase